MQHQGSVKCCRNT